MKKEFNREEYNIACALFTDWVLDDSFPDKGRVYRKGLNIELDITLKFHEDWNWIMEVIKKILKYCSENDCLEEHYYPITDAIPDTEATVQAIWEFLNWYNENSK